MQQVKAKTTLLASLLRNVKRDAAKDVTVFVIILRFKGEINFFKLIMVVKWPLTFYKKMFCFVTNQKKTKDVITFLCPKIANPQIS
jgi:hypothetical protein